MRHTTLISCSAAILGALALGQAAVAQTPVAIAVTRDLVREHFCGPGFQAEMFLDTATPEFFDQVLAKRWREMNPRFARLMLHRERFPDAKPLECLAQQILFLKEATGTEVYLTGGLRDVAEGEQRRAWARTIVDELDYLLKAGATNIKWHCSTNELSLHGWASLRKDLPTFRSYHQALHEEIRRRNLPVTLLATDASPISLWNTIEWAAQNMDDITGVYGGHHYINEFRPEDPAFYEWFRDKCSWAVGLAKAKGKDFIIGEFGTAQYFDLRWGVRWDTPEFFEMPRTQPMAGLQLAEATMAAINAGVYAMGYWTFTDYPDDRGGSRGVNQCGLFKWMTGGATPRAPYYSYSLMTRFFRGPAAVHQVEVQNARLRVTAIQNEETKSWSIAVINRDARSIAVSLTLPASPAKAFRKYVYDPANVPVTEDGDLQGPAGKLVLRNGKLTDTLAPNSLAVYTTVYHDEIPVPVRGLQIVPAAEAKTRASRNSTVLRWEANPEKDICYYRIYHNTERIGSCTTAEFVDAGPTRNRPGEYTVVAVDQSGNASRPQRVARPGNNVR